MAESAEPLLTITDAAREKITDVRAGESDADALGLWVEVSGQADGAYTYTMELRPLADAGENDVIQRHDDLSVIIDGASADKLTGATLDFAGAGMVMRNPNRPAPPSPLDDRPPADLSGEVAQKVVAVLEQEINPAIAAHGGRADLVAVDDDVAYLRLSGGCQGCGLASVTLSQGIEVAIIDAVPEIERIVDVTDHDSGTNPYFEAAKK